MNQMLNNKINFLKKKQKKYKIIFFICIIICIISVIIYFFIRYNMQKNDEISKNLASGFSLTTLYSNSIGEYSTEKLEVTPEPFVIGLIQIDKIKLMYPILSETTRELLKLAPCRYYGPMPNETR